MSKDSKIISPYDAPRKVLVPGNAEETVMYCVRDVVAKAEQAIEERGAFYIALSGGSTPKVIYQGLADSFQDAIDWSKVHIFWSDERNVAPENPDSNYHMAMTNGIEKLPIPAKNIHRMPADAEDLKSAAERYEKNILNTVPDGIFDFIMLGMGDDGHTASIFPHTLAVSEQKRFVVENEVPQKKCWRMTFTYPLLNKARNVRFYVIGKGKAVTLEKVFGDAFNPSEYPSQGVGTHKNPSLWIADEEAANNLRKDSFS